MLTFFCLPLIAVRRPPTSIEGKALYALSDHATVQGALHVPVPVRRYSQSDVAAAGERAVAVPRCCRLWLV